MKHGNNSSPPLCISTIVWEGNARKRVLQVVGFFHTWTLKRSSKFQVRDAPQLLILIQTHHFHQLRDTWNVATHLELTFWSDSQTIENTTVTQQKIPKPLRPIGPYMPIWWWWWWYLRQSHWGWNLANKTFKKPCSWRWIPGPHHGGDGGDVNLGKITTLIFVLNEQRFPCFFWKMLYSVIPPANNRFIHVVLEALEQIVAVCKVPNVTSYRKYMRRGGAGGSGG